MPITNDEYVGYYRDLHAKEKYGADCHRVFLPHVLACIVDLKPKSILEFGCGQSQLYKVLPLEGVEYHRYDPAIPEVSELTVKKTDFALCTDVMEHIPEDDVEDVLAIIASISDKVFFNIATRPASKILPNGENAHCTVWSAEKWMSVIHKYWPDAVLQEGAIPSECNVLTWSSKVNPLVVILEDHRRELRAYEKAARTPDHFFKRLERRIRKVRNRIIGKK